MVSLIKGNLLDRCRNMVPFDTFLVNAVNLAWYPMVTGIVFMGVLGKGAAGGGADATFYLWVAVAFVFAYVLHMALFIWVQKVLHPFTLRETVSRTWASIVALRDADIASLVLLLVTSLFYMTEGYVGLLIALASIMVYQRAININLRLVARTEALQDTTKQLRDSFYKTVSVLTRALDSRDNTTGDHTDRCVERSFKLMHRVYGDDPKMELQMGAYLHDVGKIAIPDAILNKEGKLTDEEYSTMKSHVEKGCEIVEELDFLGEGMQIIRHHHERWDGRGYPDGLKGTEIPIAARIFTAVDSFDAIVSKRPYKDARSDLEGVKELRECAGSQFDPAIVELLVELLVEERRVTVEQLERVGGPPKVELALEMLSNGGSEVGSLEETAKDGPSHGRSRLRPATAEHRRADRPVQ